MSSPRSIASGSSSSSDGVVLADGAAGEFHVEATSRRRKISSISSSYSNGSPQTSTRLEEGERIHHLPSLLCAMLYEVLQVTIFTIVIPTADDCECRQQGKERE